MNRAVLLRAELMDAARRRALALRREAIDQTWRSAGAWLRRVVHGVAQGPWRTRKSRGDSAALRHSPRRAARARASSPA